MIDFSSIIEKYYVKGSPLYDTLMIHSRQVCEKALAVIDRHSGLPIDRQFVAEAAMLHDIGIFRCHAPEIYCFGKAQYIEHGYLGADLLRAEGLPRHALVAERHTGTGIALEDIIRNGLPLPHRPMEPLSMEEQLICYADKFYSKSKPEKEHSVEKIRQALSKYGEKHVMKFDNWHALFG
ncbi:MAG: HDIG domain-containing protein [Prevotellaceae bacterium]|jgi:uncharacterized protein|nr:HDIG domain-containing protein [Prevotellaceae bacterium]